MKRALVALSLCACGPGGSAVSIALSASVAGAPFSCTQTYASIGTSKSTIAPSDLRFFVSNVELVRAGVATPLVLDENENQGGGITLVDLEDGTGTCATNSPATYTTITGRAPHADFDTLTFTLGVPMADDHLEVIDATGPLSDPAMFLSGAAGYRHLRTAVQASAPWSFDLAAQTCSAASDASLVCKYPNLASVSLPWHPGATVDLDLAALLATSDLGATGCESVAGEAACAPLFAQLGLPFVGQGSPPAQVVFGVQ